MNTKFPVTACFPQLLSSDTICPTFKQNDTKSERTQLVNTKQTSDLALTLTQMLELSDSELNDYTVMALIEMGHSIPAKASGYCKQRQGVGRQEKIKTNTESKAH